MISRLRRRLPAAGDDQGIALITVVGAMMILTLFLLVGLNTAINTQGRSRSAQDSNTATAAAQAGVDDFLQQMNLNTEYLTTVGTGWTAWRQVQGTNSDSEYRYRVASTTGGNVLLASQGRSSAGRTGNDEVQRTAYATFTSRGFLSYVYLSDVEVVDPVLVNDPAACSKYYTETVAADSRSARNDCANIQWASGDVVNGPLHSNDALQIQGAVQFRNPTTETSWTGAQGKTGLTNDSKTWWGNETAPLPGYPPKYATSLPLPVSNTSLIDYVRPNVNGGSNPNTATARPGCYYQGATRIIFTGTTMKVLSPGTTRSDTPAECYNYQTPNTEQTVNIPAVIYVDQNNSTSPACTFRAIGYPITNESYSNSGASATSWGKSPNYACSRGSAYLQGTANARVTVNAVDDVVFTGNTTVSDISSGSNNVIGVIAGNYAWVYNPINSSGQNLLTSSTRINTIQAGILALRHSFVVQNWSDGGTTGTLNVTGAISQKFRGPVGTGNSSGPVTGYLKNYVYDTRLAYLRPPYFLQPVNNTWSLSKTVFK